MKFFTIDWWSGDVDDHDSDVPSAYARHLDDIRSSLPSQLQEFANTINLHDAHLLRFELSGSTRVLRLRFRILQYDESVRPDRRRDVVLGYGGVSLFTSTADPGLGMRGPHGYGDMGYDELDVVEPGTYEHRLLFSTGIEMAVRFGSFDLQSDPSSWSSRTRT